MEKGVVFRACLSAAWEEERGPCERWPLGYSCRASKPSRALLELEKGDKMVIARRFVSVTPAAQVYSMVWKQLERGRHARSVIDKGKTKTEERGEKIHLNPISLPIDWI